MDWIIFPRFHAILRHVSLSHAHQKRVGSGVKKKEDRKNIANGTKTDPQ